ncbi:Pectinesterase inhibitor [Corchorus olitorius]|uniref:Pectinesterase inhibitor n=2 Tax=Corchorus olitorius TaxID=93759 RepID=A0A1R3K807_9ROSI|nr:Pectinesterase inhibitor [Corchorus olitorius]
MAKPDFLTIFLLLLVSNQNFSLAATAQGGEFLISKACRKESKNPDLCKSTLEADPLSKKAENYNSLCRAAMVVFRTCADGYHHAIRDINDGIAGFDMNNFEEASSEIGAVFQSVRECKDTGLTMFQKLNNEIEAFGDVVSNLLEKLVPGPDKY